MSDEQIHAEFEQLSLGNLGETPATPPAEAKPAEIDYLELPVGQDKYKIPLNTEVPFKHAGTMTKVPFSQLLNNYRQGAHLSEKMEAYKKQKEELEKLRGDTDQFTNLRQKYEAIQKWSEENPDQWERLYGLWQEREKAFTNPNPADPNSIVMQEFKTLKDELKQLKEFKSSYEKQAEEYKIQQDMEAVEKEISQFSKDFSEINLDEKDEEGIPLKSRIISFGVQHQIPDFESAALKYLKPRLMEIAQERALKGAVKNIKTDKQQGIVGRSSKPLGQSSEVDPRKLSWNELGELARAEYK